MNKAIKICPMCEHDLVITKAYCAHCGTSITGQFGITPTPLNRLNAGQMEFVLTFIRCGAKFKRMEEDLGISYPTIKNRFNEILAAVGLGNEMRAG